MTSSKPVLPPEDPMFKYWRLDLQHMNGGGTIQSIAVCLWVRNSNAL